MEQDRLLALISRIYDTTLDASLWPSVMHDLAHAAGASGAMIFKLSQHGAVKKIDCPYISENYDPVAVQDYLRKHNAQEIIDQAEFAEISGENAEINLVNDTEFVNDPDRLAAQDNVRDMLSFGLRHRAGTLLNKDSWQIDRFSLQYRADRGPASDAEKRVANLILPHVAKALRIGRPLMTRLSMGAGFGAYAQNLNFGICLLSPKGHPIATNGEFDRIVSDYGVFQYLQNGQLTLSQTHDTSKYQELLSDRNLHGQTGAYPRRQSVFFPLSADDSGLFVEVCPANHHSDFGKLPPETRLITVMDSATVKQIGADVVSRFFPLSKTEEEVLELIGAGHTNKQIAQMRNRSLETVNSQVKSLLFKTYTRNRTELVQLSLSLAAPFQYGGQVET